MDRLGLEKVMLLKRDSAAHYLWCLRQHDWGYVLDDKLERRKLLCTHLVSFVFRGWVSSLTCASAKETCPLPPPTSTTLPEPKAAQSKLLASSDIWRSTIVTISTSHSYVVSRMLTLRPALHCLRKPCPLVGVLLVELIHRDAEPLAKS